MAKTYHVTLKYPDGTPMFTGIVLAEEIVEMPTNNQPSPNGTPPATSAEKITEPQRRFLFRLLAAQKVTGKDAEKHLRDYFKVLNLADVPRQAPSEYIDQMDKDKKDATPYAPLGLPAHP